MLLNYHVIELQDFLPELSFMMFQLSIVNVFKNYNFY